MSVRDTLVITTEAPWVFANRYEIRGLLGAGGMGFVYKAFDLELEDLVALKLIRRELLQRPGVVDRFRQEVKLARRVTHRNVARVYDIGEWEGERYFTMELVEGRSLTSVLEAGPLGIDDALRIGLEVCAGLEAAHAAGVVHRDLKPDNLLVAADGRVTITDFGIARTLLADQLVATMNGEWVGTPVYMSPEAVGGSGATGALSDLFSVGVILFEAMTCELPWTGQTALEAGAARLRLPPADPRTFRPEIPDQVAAVVLRCLARDPSARYQTARDLAAALAAARLLDEATARSSQVLSSWSVDQAPAALATPAREVKSVAVLPLMGAAVPPHLTEGLHDAIVASLSRTQDLRVRSRGMVARCDPTADDPLDIAERLDAQVLVWLTLTTEEAGYVLTGTAESVPDRFRLWSETMRAEPTALFELAERVAERLRAHLTSTAAAPQSPRPADSVTDLYLRAREAYHTFWYDGTARAVRLLEEARALAPDDAVILASYALARVRLSFFTGEGLDEALIAARAASDVAPENPVVQVALASIRLQRNELVDAVGHLRAALREAPSQPEANWLLARLLLESDMLELAVRRLRWALELEPEQHLVRLDLARALALHGEWDEVDLLTAAAPEGHEAGNWLERARFALWRRDVRAAASGLCIVPADPTGPVALAKELFEVVGRGEEPFHKPAYRAFLLGSRRTPRREAFAAQIEAEISLALGRPAQALDAIARAMSLGLSDLAWLNHCPLLAPVEGSAPLEAARSALAERAAAVRDAVYAR